MVLLCSIQKKNLVMWRGCRVVEGGGLENRWGVTASGGSNPSLSANRTDWESRELSREVAPSV